MNEASLRKLTGVILILTPVAFNVFFTLLTVTFEYPDILREPTDHILRQFDAGGSGLVAIWYGFMLTAVLFVPVAVLVHKGLVRQDKGRREGYTSSRRDENHTANVQEAPDQHFTHGALPQCSPCLYCSANH